MIKNGLYIIVLVIGLVILGQYKPKISLALAGLIFVSSVILNIDKVKEKYFKEGSAA